MNTKQCKHCDEIFNLDSIAKKAAGGKINECPDCVEELGTETAVKYTGTQVEEIRIVCDQSACYRSRPEEAHERPDENG